MPWTSPACDIDVTPAVPDVGTSGMAGQVSMARALWVDPMPGQVEEYRRILKDFAADALIVDMIALGARATAELEGLPYITIGHNPRVAFGHANLPATWKADNGIGQVDA
ncbi:hypothetical protein ABVK25_012218 [Lepraria finkii]|uniref:Uncharacterized protein n=1 Tax=Lepraria finkii TaxID=1340010 RepID=A0ABR4ANU5_9LECA